MRHLVSAAIAAAAITGVGLVAAPAGAHTIVSFGVGVPGSYPVYGYPAYGYPPYGYPAYGYYPAYYPRPVVIGGYYGRGYYGYPGRPRGYYGHPHWRGDGYRRW